MSRGLKPDFVVARSVRAEARTYLKNHDKTSSNDNA
jgi:hypothetical protein